MATHKTTGLPVGITVDEAGLEFCVGWGEGNTDVVISLEFPDYSGWTGVRTATRDVTVSREDWQAIVEHIAAEHREREVDDKVDAPLPEGAERPAPLGDKEPSDA